MTAGFAGTALRVTSGGFAWVAHFAVVYGVTALACARGASQLVPWVVAGASVVAAAACLAVVFIGWKEAGAFERWLSRALAGVALLAIVFETLPLLVVPPCG